jgi:AcrR family transcriptional regulator
LANVKKSKTRRAKPGRPHKDAGRDVRTVIVEAAIRQFARHGFNNVSLKDITGRAGVSVGLVRHYFGSKEALIAEANRQVVDKLRELFQAMQADLSLKDGAKLIEQLQQRAVEHLAPRVDLLFYLKHLIIEHPREAQAVIAAYFRLLQSNFDRLETIGALAPDVSKTWLTFELMFVQLGPVFLADQIEAIIGRPAYDPAAVRERGRETVRLFKAMLRSK